MRAHEWLQHYGTTVDQALAITHACAPQHVARAAAIAHGTMEYQDGELSDSLRREMAYEALLGAVLDCRRDNLARVRRILQEGYLVEADFMKMIPPTELEAVLRAALLCLDTPLMDHTSAATYHLMTI